MGQTGAHRERSVGEKDPNVQHLGREVTVGVPSAAQGAPTGRLDADPDVPHVRLEADRLLDGTREAPRRALVQRDPQVLVENASELDPRLE